MSMPVECLSKTTEGGRRKVLGTLYEEANSGAASDEVVYLGLESEPAHRNQVILNAKTGAHSPCNHSKPTVHP